MAPDHWRLSPRVALQQELLGEETKLVQEGAAEKKGDEKHLCVTQRQDAATEGSPQAQHAIAIMTTGIVSGALLGMPKPSEVLKLLCRSS